MKKAAPRHLAQKQVVLFCVTMKELYRENREMAAKLAGELVIITDPEPGRAQLARIGGVRSLDQIVLFEEAETPYAELQVTAGNQSSYTVMVTCLVDGKSLRVVGSMELNKTKEEKANDFVRERMSNVDETVVDEMELKSFSDLMQGLTETGA